MATQTTKLNTIEDEKPPTNELTFTSETRIPGYSTREDATDHYLRQIRNGVAFLAVLAGLGVAGGIIMGIVIAVNTAPTSSLY